MPWQKYSLHKLKRDEYTCERMNKQINIITIQIHVGKLDLFRVYPELITCYQTYNYLRFGEYRVVLLALKAPNYNNAFWEFAKVWVVFVEFDEVLTR